MIESRNALHLRNRGIHYAATPMEAALCKGQKKAVVGGGNSVGQAAVFLSRTASHVHLLIRGASLASTMSVYLIQRILSSPGITLHAQTEIESLDGDSILRKVTWFSPLTNNRETCSIGKIFLRIGASPNTAWLRSHVDLDDEGFVLTGRASQGSASPCETTVHGIYAVGDVRSGSIKRVASAVGDGSAVVSEMDKYLAVTTNQSETDLAIAPIESQRAAVDAIGTSHLSNAI